MQRNCEICSKPTTGNMVTCDQCSENYSRDFDTESATKQYMVGMYRRLGFLQDFLNHGVVNKDEYYIDDCSNTERYSKQTWAIKKELDDGKLSANSAMDKLEEADKHHDLMFSQHSKSISSYVKATIEQAQSRNLQRPVPLDNGIRKKIIKYRKPISSKKSEESSDE